MGKNDKEDARLAALVRLALPVLQEAEQQCTRTGPGAKPTIPEWLMAALIMIGVLKKKKTKSAQLRFVCEKRKQIAGWLGDRRFPSRTTFFRRYRRAHRFYRAAISLQAERAIAEGVTDPKDVAVDKSLIAAHGPPWHKRDRKAGRVPARVDRDSTWSYSEHHGWVQGYSFEVVVSSTPEATVFPLVASVDTASAAECQTFSDKIAELPEAVENVSADAAYDANHLGECVEYDEHGRRTGRRFLCPENPRNNRRRKTKPGGADASRARSRRLRQRRRKFLETRRGRALYTRRNKTVEPFISWLKSLFELDNLAWHRGLENNRTQILTAIFAYQLLVRYNHRRGNKNGRIRWITDTL
jgi:hypothetical protein